MDVDGNDIWSDKEHDQFGHKILLHWTVWEHNYLIGHYGNITADH